VERNVLTMRGGAPPVAVDDTQMLAAERPTGSFSRQLFLGDSLDTERIGARYDSGVAGAADPGSGRPSRARSPSAARTTGPKTIEA